MTDKAEELSVQLWDEVLYENNLGRGRSKLLTQEQKDAIIALVTSSRNNREKESWQAIHDGDFNEIVPSMSVTTFENVMYEAGYARRRPGWKPALTPEHEKERYAWALEHNPELHEEYDNKGFDFHEVVFTDETPARIGEERGMQRTWCKENERWDEGVKHDRNRNDCYLQFYGAFRYNFKGPCHVYHEETEQEKRDAEAHIKRLNEDTKHRDNKLQIHAQTALNQLGASDTNRHYNTRKKQYVPSKRADNTSGVELSPLICRASAYACFDEVITSNTKSSQSHTNAHTPSFEVAERRTTTAERRASTAELQASRSALLV